MASSKKITPNVVLHFKFAQLPLIPCKAPGGQTRIARVINPENSKHIGGGFEEGEYTCFSWKTLYDLILFIHEGSMTVRTSHGDFAVETGDILFIPEGTPTIHDMSNGRCSYFWATYPVDWSIRHAVNLP